MTRFKDVLSILLVCSVLIEASFIPNSMDQAVILDMHHRAREMVQPPARRMLMMKYSSSLEKLARMHVLQCQSASLYRKQFPATSNTSVNVVLFSGYKPSFADAIGGWMDQRREYNYKRRSCSSFCWDYLHMIHDQTTEVGCAMNLCNGLNKQWSEPQYLVACVYNRKHTHELMKAPYERGEACQACSSNAECYRNQCVLQATCKDVLPLIAISGDFSSLAYLSKNKYNVILSG